MDDNTVKIVCLIVIFSWIPILALGKAITSIIEAYKQSEHVLKIIEDDNNKEENEDE